MLTTAALLYALTARPCLLRAVEWAESRGDWLAVAGSHRGPYQIAVRFSRLPWWALHVEPVARIEAWRQLAWWRARAAGDWHGALRGYRHGYAGVRGERGQQYADAVLARCEGKVRP